MPYLVYLPDGSVSLARTGTACNAWAVATVSQRKGRWQVDAVHNTGSNRGDDTVATAERVTEEEAVRFSIREQVEVRN